MATTRKKKLESEDARKDTKTSSAKDQEQDDDNSNAEDSGETREEPKDENDTSKETPTRNEKKEEAKKTRSVPHDRDICIGEDTHVGTMLLYDLIRLHYVLVKKEKDAVPTKEKDVKELAHRLTKLMLHGKEYELSGLRDVPRPFLKGEGWFFEKKGDSWVKVDKNKATSLVAKAILSKFKSISEESAPSADLQKSVDILFKNSEPSTKGDDEPSSHSAPRPCDVLFLPINYPWEENMPYEHQMGNKHMLYLASQNVASDTNDSVKRVDAALKLVTSVVESNNGTESELQRPRYVIQSLQDNQNFWKEMDRTDVAEFSVVFVFEVYLEKQIHGLGASSQIDNASTELVKPSTTSVDAPTPYDVLFGRGGMTNGHPGNRRFRDIIALHRPDYIRATKMDKPNVARRIVRAIRQGDPPGRFLKKCDDGKWYDVGDRCAAEKTSQGLRERSNAEKRQRSALREALRIRKEDLADGEEGDESNKKQKTISESPVVPTGLGIVPAFVGVGSAPLNYAGGIPLSLSMKEKPKEPKAKKTPKRSKEEPGEGDSNTESLPPNAVDKDGNILVTDYDILCGRGGLTNHHKGNKRFRDIVALHRPDYVRAPKIQKPSVARVIVRAIRNGDPPGRFLKKDEKTGKWIDIGDKKAAEKTSQALREKTFDEKDSGPTGTTPFVSPTVNVPPPLAPVAAVKSEDKEEVGGKSRDKNGTKNDEGKANGDEKTSEVVKRNAKSKSAGAAVTEAEGDKVDDGGKTVEV